MIIEWNIISYCIITETLSAVSVSLSPTNTTLLFVSCSSCYSITFGNIVFLEL